MMPRLLFFRRWLKLTGSSLLLSALATPLWADDDPIGRSRAAAIAQNAFGGKVLSVDEERVPTLDEQDEPASGAPASPETAPDLALPPVENLRYVVKLLQQGGRIKVIKLDATGKIL